MHGMPSVVAFYDKLAMRLATYIVYFSIIISMSTIVICTCHVEKLEQHHNSNMLPTYICGHKKLSKLDDRKNQI